VISASAIEKQVQLALTDRSMLSQGRDLPGSRPVVAGLRGGAALGAYLATLAIE